MKSLLLTTDNLKATVEGRKTVTRRLIKPQPRPCTVEIMKSVDPAYYQSRWPIDLRGLYPNTKPSTMLGDTHKSRFLPGDVVYLKEAWATLKIYDELSPNKLPDIAPIWFWADGNHYADKVGAGAGKVRSPLFLPERFARYFATILDVRPERLQEIDSEIEDNQQDTIKEGCPSDLIDIPAARKLWFENLWDSINPKFPFSSNPFIWRIEYKLNQEG